MKNQETNKMSEKIDTPNVVEQVDQGTELADDVLIQQAVQNL